MTIENDFLTFATGGGANVLSQSAYATLGAVATGYQSGVAQSAALNKTWRQSSIMSAVLAQFIVNQTGQTAIDDGTTATLLANLSTAVGVAARQNPVLPDTGAANAYVVANLSAFTAYPTVSGLTIDVSILNANTGASTLNVDGLGTKPILGLGLQPLQGGELIVKGVACLLYIVASTVNSGNGAWVLTECAGGAQQVAPAVAPTHAVQLQQATGRLLRTTIYVKVSGTQSVSVNGSTLTTTGATTFTPLSLTTAVKIKAGGGGGAGGGAPVTTGTTVGFGVGGEGAAYGEGWFTNGFSGIAITVGSGGVATTTAGGNGGTSSAGSLLTAPGGPGGSAQGPSAGPIFVGNATTPSIATGANLLSFPGNVGAPGCIISSGAFASGAGGSCGMFGADGTVVGGTGVGHPGTQYGQGGSGAGTSVSAGSAQVGGNGQSGIVIIEEYA